jgi:hypothetical protein
MGLEPEEEEIDDLNLDANGGAEDDDNASGVSTSDKDSSEGYLEPLEESISDDADYTDSSSDDLHIQGNDSLDQDMTSDCESESLSQDPSAMNFENVATTVFGVNNQITETAAAVVDPSRHPWYWTRSRVQSWSTAAAGADEGAAMDDV